MLLASLLFSQDKIINGHATLYQTIKLDIYPSSPFQFCCCWLWLYITLLQMYFMLFFMLLLILVHLSKWFEGTDHDTSW